MKKRAVLCPIFVFPLYSILVPGQGFGIPGRLGYLHLIDYPDPNVSCLSHRGEFIGNKAVDMVAGMINRNEFRQSNNPYMLSVPLEWHEGTTCPDRGS